MKAHLTIVRPTPKPTSTPIKSGAQIAVGIMAAFLVLAMAVQTADFGLLRDQMTILKSLARWNEKALTK